MDEFAILLILVLRGSLLGGTRPPDTDIDGEPYGPSPNPQGPLQSFASEYSTEGSIAAVLIRILEIQNPGAIRCVILRKANREFEDLLIPKYRERPHITVRLRPDHLYAQPRLRRHKLPLTNETRRSKVKRSF